VLGLLSAHYCRQFEMRRSIVVAWIAGTAVTIAACVAGVMLFLARAPINPFLYGFGSLPPGPYPRVMGLFVNANMLCSYLSAAGVMILASERARLIRSTVARPAVVAVGLAAVLTFSPNLGGLALAFSLWFAATMPSEHQGRAAIIRWGGTAAAVGFVLAILLSPTLLTTAEASVWTSIEPSSRVQTWIEATKVFLTSPWVGAGPGADVAHVSYINASSGSELLTDAHNTWLSVLAHTGVFGFIPFAVATGMLMARMRRTLDVTPQGAWRSGLELAFLSSLLYPSLSGSFEDSRHVWVLMGMVHAAQTPASVTAK
ncbi:MAG TPA: O-antigen ligase family protein, partial [Vicinamibacterales bacterium]